MLPATSGSGSKVYSQINYDLTGSAVSVQFVQPPNVGNGSIYSMLLLEIDGNNREYFSWANGSLFTSEVVGGTYSETSRAFDPVAHAWWRIRESGGTIYWDVSPDGVTWNNLRSKSPGIALTSLSVQLTAAYWGTEPSPGVAIFDNVNTVPAALTGSGTLSATVTAGVTHYYSDNFNRANGAPGSNWTLFNAGPGNNLVIAGNELATTGSGEWEGATWTAALPENNHRVGYTVGSIVPDIIYAFLRGNASNQVLVGVYANGNLKIYTQDGDYIFGDGVERLTGSLGVACAAGQDISFEAVDHDYIVKLNGVTKLTWTDSGAIYDSHINSSHRQVSVGLYPYVSGSATINSFYADDLGAFTPPPTGPAQLTYTVSQSNCYSEDAPATYAGMNDGDASGASGETGIEPPAWLEADLGSAKYIDHIVVGYDYLTNVPGGPWGPHWASGHEIEYWDGSAWVSTGLLTPVYEDTGSTDGLVSIPIDVTSQRVRLSKPTDWMAVTEFQVWGTP